MRWWEMVQSCICFANRVNRNRWSIGCEVREKWYWHEHLEDGVTKGGLGEMIGSWVSQMLGWRCLFVIHIEISRFSGALRFVDQERGLCWMYKFGSLWCRNIVIKANGLDESLKKLVWTVRRARTEPLSSPALGRQESEEESVKETGKGQPVREEGTKRQWRLLPREESGRFTSAADRSGNVSSWSLTSAIWRPFHDLTELLWRDGGNETLIGTDFREKCQHRNWAGQVYTTLSRNSAIKGVRAISCSIWRGRRIMRSFM